MQSDAALTLMWLIIATYFMVLFCINGDSKEKKDETTKQPRISLKKDTTSIVMQTQIEDSEKLKELKTEEEKNMKGGVNPSSIHVNIKFRLSSQSEEMLQGLIVLLLQLLV